MLRDQDSARRGFIHVLRAFGVLGLSVSAAIIITALEPVFAGALSFGTARAYAEEAHAVLSPEAARKYKFNDAESQLIQRYALFTVRVTEKTLGLAVVDTQLPKGDPWRIVHPGQNSEYDARYQAVIESQKNSKSVYKDFKRAWQINTSDRVPQLMKDCPRQTKLLEFPNGYPNGYLTEGYALVRTFFIEIKKDGTLKYELDKKGKKNIIYMPVKFENDKIAAVVTPGSMVKNKKGEYEYVYQKTADLKGLSRDEQGRLIRVLGREYVAYKNSLEDAASRIVYNEMYGTHQTANAFFIMDDNGPKVWIPFPDNSIGTSQRFHEACEAKVTKIEEQQKVPLKDVIVYQKPKSNEASFYLSFKDEKGKVISTVTFHPDGPYPPEFQKAIEIIEGKAPFVPKPTEQSELPEK